jgi:fibronectin type 3 domain-containing protein
MRYQVLVSASELGNTARSFTALSMYCPDTSYNQISGTYYGAKIYFCHTTRATLSTNFNDNYSGNTPVQVLSRAAMALSWTENLWNQIGFDSAFNYNGTDNLIIEIRWTSASGAIITGVTTPVAGKTLMSTVNATSGLLQSYRSVFQLQYPEFPDVPTGLSATDGTPTNMVSVSWFSANWATSYEVWRHTANNSAAASRVAQPTDAYYADYNATPGVTYYYWVKAVNAAGVSAFSSPDSGYRAVSAPPAPSPPTPPTGLAAGDGVSTDFVPVTWNAVSGATSYEVWRHTSANSAAATKLTQVTGASYDDASAVAGVTYYYWVKAVNAAGASAFSSPDSGYRAVSAPPAPAPPTPPTGVAAGDGASTDFVPVTWNAVSGSTSYEVWRHTSANSAAATKLNQVTGISYDDASATAGVTYYYWVKTVNSAGTSAFSDPDSGYRAVPASPAPPAPTPPAAPTGVAAGDGTSTDFVPVTWNAVSGATSYEVWRHTSAISAFATKLAQVAGTSYDDFSATAGITYYYWLKAVNAAGASAFSDPDSGYRAYSTMAPPASVTADFDGDGLDDPALYLETTGAWKVKLSREGHQLVTATFGGSGFHALVGDFDGDGLDDPTIYSEQSGFWTALLSASGYAAASIRFGGPGYQPAPGDYDGDGKTDPAIYQAIEAVGQWSVLMSANGYALASFKIGRSGYQPIPGDYDGDGKTDPAVYHPETGLWQAQFSSRQYATASLENFGGAGFCHLLGDFDGDGRADPAVYNQATGAWLMQLSDSLYTTAIVENFGGAGYLPVVGDFDGDRRTDLGLYQPDAENWLVKLSASGYTLAAISL